MRMIGVDVGGTFTDLVYCDMEYGRARHSQGVDDARRSVARHPARRGRALRGERRRSPTSIDYLLHGTTTATNAVLEHKGARTGMVTNHGLSRHRAYRAASAGRALFDHAGAALAEPSARAAPPSQGRARTSRSRRAARNSSRSNEEDVVAAARALESRKASRRSRSASCSPISIPRTRIRPSASWSGSCRACSSRPLRRCRRSSGNSSASRPPRFAPSSARRCAAYIGKLDASLREAGLRADLRIMASNGGVATPAMVAEKPVDDPALRPRRGRSRRRLGRRTERPAQAHHLRHRRHQRRHRHRRRRPLRRDRPAQHFDRRLPAAVADDRHSHHRRGRRLDRLCRRTAAPSASGRAAPAPFPAPPPTGAAERSRPSPTPMSCSAASTRTIFSAAA